jgi:phosphatidate cytidylyltransferase
MQFDVAPNVLIALGGLYVILAIASAWVAVLRWRAPEKDRTELVQRIRSWWIIVTVFTAAMVMSRGVAVIFFAFVSFLALKEYLSIVPTRRADRRVLFWAYLAIPVQYYWVAQAWYGMFIIFIPV